MRGWLIIFGIMVCNSISSFGQLIDMNISAFEKQLTSDPLKDLEKQLMAGKVRALRDIGTFLDGPKKKNALQLLSKFSLFSVAQIDLARKPGRQEWLDFYYKNQSSIRFSSLLHAYYLTPIEKQNSTYDLKKLKYSISGNRFQFSQAFADKEVAPKIIVQEIQRLIEAARFSHDPMELWEFKNKAVATARPHINNNNPVLIDKIAELLTYFRNEKDFKQIVALSKMGMLSEKSAIKHLAYLSNNNLYSANLSEKEIVDQYVQLLDSLETLPKVINAGYKKLFGFNKSHFTAEVDYYGRILSEATLHPYVQHNVIRDLISTHDPTALFYLASQTYVQRFGMVKSIWQREDYYNFLEKLTYTRVGVQFEDGNINFEKPVWEDARAHRNYLTFWASRSSEFKWNKELKIFENFNLLNEERTIYEVALQQLTSKDEKVAFAGLDKLVNGEAEIIIPLLTRYEDFLKTTHPQLPNLNGDVLPTLILLYEYCEANEIKTQNDESIQIEFEKLNELKHPKERFEQENKIIEKLNIEDISALEIWAFKQNRNKENALSADRIINHFYDKFWCEISDSETLTSLYLKKLSLFQPTKNYLKLADINACPIGDKKNAITTNDGDVTNALKRLLAKEIFTTNRRAFFHHPELFTELSLEEMPSLQHGFIADVFQALKNPKTPKHKHRLTRYLNKNIDFGHVSELMTILEKKQTQEWNVLLLEQLYQTETPHQTDEQQRNFWLKKWKESGNDPMKLGEKIWFQHSQLLKTQPRIEAAHISILSNSPFFDESKLETVLRLLKKVEPKSHLLRINFSKPISVEKALPYFEELPFTESYLKNFPSYFKEEERHLLIDFLIKKSESLEQGVIFNDLIGHKWFLDLLEKDKLSSATIGQLSEMLNTYYDESSWLTEDEEINIEVNLFHLENQGKPLIEKLKASLAASMSSRAKATLQMNLLSRLDYKDLATAVQFWTEFTKTPEMMGYNFISHDFGIPFFDFEDEAARVELIKKLNTEKPIEVYSHYLKEFGVDFQKKDGAPDIPAIRKIFKNDLNMPFSGNGGVVRDNYIFSIIKYLEFYYKDDLGFHPKLNENQTFYQFNSRKRVEAWLKKFEEVE